MNKKYRATLALSTAVLALLLSLATGASAGTSPDGQGKARRRAATRTQRRASKPGGSAATQEVFYTCPMHHDVHSKTAGTCPKCGMELEVEESAGKTKSE
jgi:hypothetical protein